MQKLIDQHGNKINFLAIVAICLTAWLSMYLFLIIVQNSETIHRWCMVLGRGLIGM